MFLDLKIRKRIISEILNKMTLSLNSLDMNHVLHLNSLSDEFVSAYNDIGLGNLCLKLEQLGIPEEVLDFEYCETLYDKAITMGVFGSYSMNRNVMYYLFTRFYRYESYRVIDEVYYEYIIGYIFDYREQEMLYGFPMIVNPLTMLLIDTYALTINDLIDNESSYNFILVIIYLIFSCFIYLVVISIICIDKRNKSKLSLSIMLPYPEYAIGNVLFINQFKKYYNENY